MYYGCSAGGWNKSHDQVERTPRFDSFDLRDVHYWGHLMCSDHHTRDRFLETYYAPEDGSCTLFPSWGKTSGITIKTSTSNNGFGGWQIFFHCPQCGKRVRFLYAKEQRFCCRDCAGLNYRSQQQTKNCQADIRDGLRYVDAHLTPAAQAIDGASFVDYTPEKPRGMHRTTYLRHLVRFRRYQLRYADKVARDFERFAKWL